MSEHISLQWDNFHKNMSAGMQSLLESEDLVDVTLAVEGRQLKAHKMVLSLCSPYFRQLFQSSPCKHPIVFMKDVSYTALIDLLQFMYQGEVQVAQENLPTFIKTAEALQIQGLADDSMNQNEESIESTKSPFPIQSATKVKRCKSLASKRARVSSPSPSFSAAAPVVPVENLIFLKTEPSDNIEASTDKETTDEMEDSYVDETLVEENTLMETTEDDPKPGTSSDGIGESQPKNIDEEVLKELTVADIDILIPAEKFGPMIKFSKYLSLCKEQNELPRVEDFSSTSASSSFIDSSQSTGFGTNDHNFDLSKLLHQSVSGKGILENYKKNLNLTAADRNILAYLIAEYWINSNMKPEFSKCFSEIKRIFPTETENTYLNTKNQRGKLADKYYSLRKKFKKAGYLQTRPKKIEQDSSSRSSGMEDLLEDDLNPDIEHQYYWLKYNHSPESLVLDKWKITFPLRRKHILDENVDFYAEWPIVKQQIAVLLVELDFEKLHPLKKFLLFTKWQAFCEKIIPILKTTIKDPKNKIILEKIDDITNENSRNCVIINLLHAYLIPTTQTIKLDEKKVRYKPSILDSQTSLIVHVTNKSYIYTTFEQRKVEYMKRKWTIQPTIVVVGDSIENLTEFYVYVNDTVYQVDTFLKALSVTFQLHQVLNVHYAIQCVQVWNLIEEYFYEISVSEKRSTNLNALLHQLTHK